MTTEPIQAKRRDKWSDVENAAISDPRMMEIADGKAFMKAMGERTGVLRSVGSYTARLFEMAQAGADVNIALLRNLRAAKKNADNNSKTNGKTSNGHAANSKKTAARKSSEKPAVEPDRFWVSCETLAWLMDVDTSQVYRLNREGEIASRSRSPELLNRRLYSVVDGIKHLRSRTGRYVSRIAASAVTEMLGAPSSSFERFSDPENDGMFFRADIVQLWTALETAPLSPPGKHAGAEKTSRKQAMKSAAKSAMEQFMKSVSKPTAKPVVKPTAKPAAKPVVKAPVKTAAKQKTKASLMPRKLGIVTPPQAAAIADRDLGNATDVVWMLHGVRRGLLDKNDVADMVVKLAKKN